MWRSCFSPCRATTPARTGSSYHLGQFAGLAPFTIFRPAQQRAIRCRLEAQRQHEIKDLFEHRQRGHGTMVVCIAGKVPMPRYDRGQYLCSLEWDEVHQEARCSDTSYVLGIEHADDFFPRIWVEMNRRSHDLQLRPAFGAAWQRSRTPPCTSPGLRAGTEHVLVTARPRLPAPWRRVKAPRERGGRLVVAARMKGSGMSEGRT